MPKDSIFNRVREAGLVLGALGVIGFIGVVWLMIYGNLGGNLGFGQDTLAFTNETSAFSNAGFTPSSADNRVNGLISLVTMTNATGGEIITSANYSISGVVITPTGSSNYNATNVNVSYSVSFDETGKVNTDGVINNISGGFSTFFGFSNTFFTIAAIILLIAMLIGLLAIVMTIQQGRGGKGSGFAG